MSKRVKGMKKLGVRASNKKRGWAKGKDWEELREWNKKRVHVRGGRIADEREEEE